MQIFPNSILQPQQILSRCDAGIAQEIELVTVDILTQIADCFVRQGTLRLHGVNAAGVQLKDKEAAPSQ